MAFDIKTARDNFKKDKDHWGPIYRKAEADADFMSDEPNAQWEPKEAQARINSGLPVVTVDHLEQFVNQVTNDIRQNTPAIEIIPSDGGDTETADIIKGKVRDIEYASNADNAYDMAATYAVEQSIGFIKIENDYINEKSFEQSLYIRRVTNPLAVYIDCDSTEIDGSDAKRGTIIEEISVSEFKKRYPEKEVSCFENEQQESYEDTDSVTIAEYYEIDEEPIDIGLLESGEIEAVKKGVEYIKTRKTARKIVRRYTLSGKDKLEETVFPGKYIPLIPVYGKEAWRKGKRHLRSLIRKSKQAQQLVNLWNSIETELLQKQPRAYVMAGEGQVEDYAEDWIDPEKAAVLRYKQTDADGNQLPPPQRLQPPQVPVGVVNAAMQKVEDIKATLGMYNASVGEIGNEISGVAISRRKEEGDVSQYHFADNLNKSISHVGRVVVCALPEVFDTQRVVRTINGEDKPEEVGINGKRVEGQERDYFFTKGRYDVKAVTGTSYATKRQEAASFFNEVLGRSPEMMNIMGDLLFENMDFAGAQAMAERMRKVIDPKFLDEDSQDPRIAQLQMQLEEAQSIITGLETALNSKNEDIALKRDELRLKEASESHKAKIDAEKIRIDIAKLEKERDQMILDYQFKFQQMQSKPSPEVANDVQQVSEDANLQMQGQGI